MKKNQKSEVGAALKACGGSFVMVGLFSLIINLLVLASPLYMMQVYDRVLSSRSYPTLAALTVLVVGLLLFMGLLELIRSRVLVRVGARIDHALNARLFESLMCRALVQTGADGGPGGGAGPLRDLKSLREFLSGQGPFAFFDAPWVPIFLAVIFLMHPLLGAVAAAGALLLFLIALLNELRTRTPLARAARQAGHSEDLAAAGQRNAEVLKAMGMVPGVLRNWQDQHREALHHQGVASDRAGSLGALTKAVRLILQAAILGTGAALVIQQAITPGVMIAASIIMARALSPVEQAIGNWRGFVGARAAYRRLSDLLGRFPARAEPMRLPGAKTALTVDHVIAGAPGGSRPIVSGLRFELKAGEALGVIGSSASGKSSLARLLVGVWPTLSGAVRLDGIALDQWHPGDLGRQIGYLPQDVELFAGSVSENIARFAAEPDPAAILAAAKAAGIHEMIARLPDGYNSQIGEAGALLSGGQRQRLGLARALYGDPFLVVLDEPNANLDADGDVALSQAITGMRNRGQIVVVMTHRPSAIEAVDKLLIMQDGRQRAFGPRDQVLQSETLNAGPTGKNVTALPKRKAS